MSFTEEFNKMQKVLKSKCGIQLEKEKYDALIIKKMSATNCIKKNKTSNQSHIAITGEQMNLFPYIYQEKYIERDDKKIKNFFVFKAPINIFKGNCDYLNSDNGIDFKSENFKEEEMCIYPRSGGDQIQLSMKNEDSSDFIKFRELINENDFFVVLKYKEKLLYDAFVIKNKDGSEEFSKPSIFEYDSNRHTFVKGNSIKYENENKNKVLSNKIDKPHQRIFFGAPGTGKSYRLNKEASKYFGSNYERVTFHQNYMYGNFVGAFKPFPEDTGETYLNKKPKKSIVYKYVPGPLMRLLVKALKNRNTNYLMLIEEINRANVAAVFGDFFQLLDCKEDGESEYSISTSEDLRMYIEAELSDVDEDTKIYIKGKIGEEYDRLILPSNIYIWSTMNSADQGVMPMDTAFKRRWEFTYIGIDEALEDMVVAKEFENYMFRISRESVAKWNDFRVEVNKRLLDCKVSEDKLIGPYFISKSILKSRDLDKITETIKNKVLMYIYDDVGKPHRNNLFVSEKASTYSLLCSNFDKNGKAIFRKPLEIEESINENEVTYDNISVEEQKSEYAMPIEEIGDDSTNKAAEKLSYLDEEK